MASSTELVFAGKSVATSAISFWINKAFTCLNKYFKAEGMQDIKKRLRQLMPNIQLVLDIANPESFKEQVSALDSWLWQLRDAVEEAEDATDELEYYELEEKAKGYKVSDSGSSFAKMRQKVVRSAKHVGILDKNLKQFTQHGTIKRLRAAVEGIDKAATDIADILRVTQHLQGVASGSQRQEHWMNKDRETGSALTASKFVGRENEKEEILRWLTKTSTAASEIVITPVHVPILSVVGHGGMGKTALAQRICEEVVRERFKVIWVHVSDSFDAASLTSKILESATWEKPRANHLEALQQDLKRELNLHTKFLLVLDDVWEDKSKDEWEKVFAPLRNSKSGSKILLTTRMQSVADMAAEAMGIDMECLKIGGLEEGENLELFNHHVFSGLNSQDFVDLKLFGEKIAKKLGGCPMLTKVVSGHLQCNMTLEYWDRFLGDLEHFKGTEKGMMELYRLSYYHLPIELQICFRYCSIFPQACKFKKKDLVLMWMSSGLISQAGNESRRPEDIGEQILAQLTRQSFFDMTFKIFQYSQRKEEYYIMHDLMHELARHVSSGECARISEPIMLENKKDTVRHIHIPCIDHLSIEEVKKISHFKNVRTIIFEGQHLVNKDMVDAIENVVQNSKALRLLHLNLENTFHLSGLADLKHLRYIYLPNLSTEGFCGLVQLYHLTVVNCSIGWQKQPTEVRYLGNIDHLRYVSSRLYKCSEFPIGRLTSLQELQNYRVHGKEGNRISAIRNLRDLRELQVQGLENVENPEEAHDAKLNEKEYLNSLSLEWSARAKIESRTDEFLIDNCEPHENIRDLTVSGYGGVRSPIWIQRLSVKNLISLKLVRCENWKYLPSLAELALLKHLTLHHLYSIQEIGESSHVSGCGCSDSSLPNCPFYINGSLPASLHTLIVRSCPELIELPVLPPSLVYLEIHDVGLTKLPRIGGPCSEDGRADSSELLRIRVNMCPSLTSLDESVLAQGQYIKTIRILRITTCEELVFVPLTFKEMNELRELEIGKCPKLRTSSEIRDKILPPSLEKLTLMQCGDMECLLLKSLHGLEFLSKLALKNCPSLKSLPSADVFKSLKSLELMEIMGCQNLSSLDGLGSLRFLFELKINTCSKLAEVGLSLPLHVSSGSGDGGEDHMVMPTGSLQIDYLEIDLPSILLLEPLKDLRHTKELVINNGSQMKNLPERWLLQNSKEIRSLKILSANSLESLPLRMNELCYLKYLLLSGAGKGKLQSLPDLPSSLQCIHVMGCYPELVKQISEKGSSEWNKISHIAKLHIGDSYFTNGKECDQESFYGASNQ
ncbi:disease resistance protein RGA2-like [Hordeum vulgare subsp. vulgare]|uniref:Predicted protein n=1 Tax=Hordeum vulgare subsp. vulgare TaxID=112509 RepID=F2D4Z4_HORVV|nr:disease resistance protein RGA2-like [Hordeum vulgare subsp. vulgare]XP_044953163.1 disease resistance protein RGA2-like [Hordeum vulgare subsp. vulgare]XP_044953164.1 disease resistance protein RGA2-like [Hordeum vulgare subsp. vulgare]XP_044953165.1 disease resistance protein RGA2-like [Hordeum vulgare subsp. vulgare]XP_044953166.1 disease resistance protein RGA2-like [Hordeum vulgare subsp. vulgare]XP_044953167.1 disease resistance protein RGA2-like [Hordeum vulgare subsp. vulgare]XP_04